MTAIIVAMDDKYGIGMKNTIPWRGTPAGSIDMRHFRQITHGHILIMGYNTWLSIDRRPLPGRINIVVSKAHYAEVAAQARGLYAAETMEELCQSHDKYCMDRGSVPAPLLVFITLNEAVEYACRLENLAADGDNPPMTGFVIGGESIYTQYLKTYTPTKAYISFIPGEYSCDTKFPLNLLRACNNIHNTYVKIESWPYADSVKISHYTWQNTDESRYLQHFKLLFDRGSRKDDRTGVGTISYFSPPELEFNLSDDTLPVLTTKRVAFKTLAKELLWFISGSTDSRVLESQGVNIWRGNTSRQFLDSRGLSDYQEGELGPGYGFQWRYCGASYPSREGGVDQIAELIRLLRDEPDSRRMIMTAWNPADLSKMALPPCHILLQLWTREEAGTRYLSGKLYQRSADSFLGVPFNIASYSLLLHILARITGMTAERLVCTYGDYHIYSNHMEQVLRQSARTPRPFPRIQFSERVKPGFDIDLLTMDDVILLGYLPYNGIMATMAI